MTTLMDEAISALRHIPDDHQDEIARVVMQIVGLEQPVYVMSPQERAAIADADHEIERGEFATDAQMEAIWAKYTL